MGTNMSSMGEKERGMHQQRTLKRNVVLGLVIGAVAALATGAFGTINPANAPSGTHLQAGAIGCAVQPDGLTVSCTACELAGVGNTNAFVSLQATYSGVVDCFNHGGNLVESHETTFTAVNEATLTPRGMGGCA
jgi:hypothetical protein